MKIFKISISNKIFIIFGSVILVSAFIITLYFGIKIYNGLFGNHLNDRDKENLKNDTLIARNMLKNYLEERFGNNVDIQIISNEAYTYFLTSEVVWGDNHYNGYWLAKVKLKGRNFEVWGAPAKGEYCDNYQTKELEEYVKSIIKKEINLQEAYEILVEAGLSAANTNPPFLKGYFDGVNYIENIPKNGAIKVEIVFINAKYSLKDKYSSILNEKFYNNRNIKFIFDIKNYKCESDYKNRNLYNNDNNTSEYYMWCKDSSLFEYHSINGKVQLP